MIQKKLSKVEVMDEVDSSRVLGLVEDMGINGGKSMSFISKILDALKLESTRERENAADGFVPDIRTEKKTENEAVNVKEDNKNNDYYARIAQQKENNLKITYNDVKYYDLKPFELDKPFMSDGHFTAIALEGDNLKKAYCYLQEVHNILFPFKHLFENALFPEKIGTDYAFRDVENHLPVSHLRLSPYTATMKKNKYPLWLWLSYYNGYGAEYIYMIYFNQQGEIGKCDLSLHGSNGARLSYESKIRRNENGLYVMRINKTLYVEPYGTRIIYHYEDDALEKSPKVIKEEKPKPTIKKSKRRYMSQADITQFARECNAYMVREERRERQAQEERECEQEVQEDSEEE